MEEDPVQPVKPSSDKAGIPRPRDLGPHHTRWSHKSDPRPTFVGYLAVGTLACWSLAHVRWVNEVVLLHSPLKTFH